MLLAGREAAGLSLDTVAQQLKLAPRQVKALEENDFTHLPGRTFVRGFIRNYARLVRIDPEPVLAALPDASGAGAGTGSLAPTPEAMGELPAESYRETHWARWLIPLAMVAIVGATAYYEVLRPRLEAARDAAKATAAVRTPEATPAPSPPVVAPPAAPASPTDGVTAHTVTLPNPLQPVETPRSEAPSPDRSPSKEAATPASGAEGGASTATAPPIVIDFRGASWVQVKDGTGAIVLSLTGSPGTSQVVAGAPPFDVVIGNIDAVSVTFQGRPVDLSAYAKQNVARMTLK
jgi:cytoskeleton protein RodZ